jgi:outer membrane protein assembly factor BamD
MTGKIIKFYERKPLRSFIFVMLLIGLSMNFSSCSSSGSNRTLSDNPESAYMLAKSSYDKKDYLDAIDEFSLIKLKFSGTSVMDKTIFYLAMSYFKNDEFILAVYEFETIIRSYPTSPLVEEATFYTAMCYYNLSPDYSLDQTYTKLALASFQDFTELYPNGKNRALAEAKAGELKNKLAYKAFKSAEMYYDLGSYKSSIVYYDYVLNEFFESDYADDALYGKIQALIKKKQLPEAAKEIERFEKRFPGSPLLKNVKSLKNKTSSTL